MLYRQFYHYTGTPAFIYFPYAISLWNSLPSDTVILSNVHNFKEAMYEYFCT